MAVILERLGGKTRKQDGLRNLSLEFIRFRKFLENMKEVIRSIEDAKDKLREEYIFDTHYILSLIDSVLEESAMLAFNASILAPLAGQEIYMRLDAHKKFAREEFLKRGTIAVENFSVPDSCRDADPETRFLQAALNWLSGPLPGGQPSVTDFIRYVTDEVFRNCRKESLLDEWSAPSGHVQRTGSCFIKRIGVSGAIDAEQDESVSLGDIQCRPFGMMLTGLANGADPGRTEVLTAVNGWMLFDEEGLSLRIYRDHLKVHLEALLYGNVASDFIFLYSQNPFDLSRVVPEGSWVDKTGQGTLAWIYDVPTDILEKQLSRLGSVLLR